MPAQKNGFTFNVSPFFHWQSRIGVGRHTSIGLPQQQMRRTVSCTRQASSDHPHEDGSGRQTQGAVQCVPCRMTANQDEKRWFYADAARMMSCNGP
jgi:hypothetical protein